MPAPTFVQAHNGTAGATTASTCTLGTTAADDILVLSWVNGGATATPTLTTGTYSGGAWTLIDSGTWATGAGGCHWSRCTGNHTGQTVIISGRTNSCSARVHRISGCITSGSPVDASTGTTLGVGAGGSLTGFNTTVADTLVCLSAAVDDNLSLSAFTKNAVTDGQHR